MGCEAEKFEVEGLVVRIEQEVDCEHADPRDNDNIGTMLCWHPSYVLGDVQFANEDGRGAIGEKRVASVSMLAPGEKPVVRTLKTEHEESGRFKSLEHLRRYLTFTGAKCVLPLYLYDHSGISMSVGHAGDNPFDSAGWDSTNVGFIYATEERIEACCGAGDEYRTEAWLETALRGEVSEYNSWLTGEVYGYVVETAAGEHLDSCWGFVGDIKYCREEAEGAAKSIAETRRSEAEKFKHGLRTVWIHEFAPLELGQYLLGLA